MSPRHHTAIDRSKPKHTSMICTSFGMWSIGPAKPHPHRQGFTYPLHGQQGITHHIVPLLHVVSWPCLASPTHSRRVITNINAFKIHRLLPSSFIRYYNNQIPQYSQKYFLSKMFCINISQIIQDKINKHF